jgi:hypothetical protein
MRVQLPVSALGFASGLLISVLVELEASLKNEVSEWCSVLLSPAQGR